jgi:hypothetical protein
MLKPGVQSIVISESAEPTQIGVSTESARDSIGKPPDLAWPLRLSAHERILTSKGDRGFALRAELILCPAFIAPFRQRNLHD